MVDGVLVMFLSMERAPGLFPVASVPSRLLSTSTFKRPDVIVSSLCSDYGYFLLYASTIGVKVVELVLVKCIRESSHLAKIKYF